MKTCKICGKELKTVNAGHLSTHKITVADYKAKYENDEVEVTELSGDEILEARNAKITPNEVTAGIFKQDEDDTTLLSEFLSKYELTKTEVVNLIDNFKYPQPTVADIVLFDKVVNLLNYDDMCKRAHEQKGNFNWSDYQFKPIQGMDYFVLKTDVENYGL